MLILITVQYRIRYDFSVNYRNPCSDHYYVCSRNQRHNWHG